jgi:imidazolonepropionase-like amidohydrolase
MRATISAGQALGQAEDVGQIAPGRFGDMVAVKGDPLQNVRLLEHVDAVVKGGKLVARTVPAP